MDLLGSEWDWQTVEISAYHFLFPSACTQADTLEHLFIDLMHDLCNRISVLKRLAYLKKIIFTGNATLWLHLRRASLSPIEPYCHDELSMETCFR